MLPVTPPPPHPTGPPKFGKLPEGAGPFTEPGLAVAKLLRWLAV